VEAEHKLHQHLEIQRILLELRDQTPEDSILVVVVLVVEAQVVDMVVAEVRQDHQKLEQMELLTLVVAVEEIL